MLIGIGCLFAVAGCGTDVGEANKTVVNKTEAVKRQEGAGGSKAARGGGLDDGPMAAPAGVKTGMPGPGAKAGG